MGKLKEEDIFEAFEEIMQHAHFWNWVPDLQVAKDVYKTFPNSYSILAPFAYSYLEELIRSTTSEYGRQVFDKNWNEIKNRKVGMSILNLAIKENKENKPEYLHLLEHIKSYYYNSKVTVEGDNRHSVAHVYMHPRFWSKESFEQLIFDIAKISKFAGF